MTKITNSLRKGINFCLVLSSAIVVMCIAMSGTVNGLENPTSKSVGFQAVIPADPPTVAATITIPQNGQVFTTMPVKLSGLCTGTVLVKIFKNGVFGGSAQCIGGSYSIFIDLFEGTNDLVAKVYDALDQQGPDSKTTTVTYRSSGFNANAPRVMLTSDYAKRGADPKQTITWPIILSGGAGPYAISIDWGNGDTELKSVKNAGTFDIAHAYDMSGLYTVVIKVTDADGNSAFLQVVAVANGALAQTSTSLKNSGPTIVNTSSKSWLWIPLVVAAILVLISYWLGGRSKLITLQRQAEKRVQY